MLHSPGARPPSVHCRDMAGLNITYLFFLLVAGLAVARAQSSCGARQPISEADMRTICDKSPSLKNSVACHIFNLCYSPATSPALSSTMCDAWRLTSSLCSDDTSISSQVPRCAE